MSVCIIDMKTDFHLYIYRVPISLNRGYVLKDQKELNIFNNLFYHFPHIMKMP